MNAAAKAIHQSNLFSGHLLEMHISAVFSCIIFLVVMILCSALGVIYTTNEYRSRFSHLQQLEHKNLQLQLQGGQLLLEQASLATPARVEQLAVSQLQMHVPADKNTYVLH